MKKILVCLSIFLYSSICLAHGVGRYCYNSYCMMCNRLHMRAGHNFTIPGFSYSQYVKLHNELHKPNPDPQLAPMPDLKLGVDSTPQHIVDSILGLIKLTKDEVFCDLGCGDGRVVISVAKKYGCKAIGVEIKKENVELARKNVIEAGVQDLVTIVHRDVRGYNLDGVDVIFLYLFTDLMEELTPEIFKVKQIISYSHEIPKIENRKVMIDGKYPVFIWSKKSAFGYL